jgi:imidazolonepropionase-like amidohydrolase
MTFAKRLTCLPLLSALLAGTALAQDFHDRRTVQFPEQVTADNPQRAPAVPRKQGFDGTLVLKGGRIFDSVKDTAYSGSVVVHQNKITAILPASSTDWPANATVLDVTGKTVMPGMIDMHVHAVYPTSETPADLKGSESDATLHALRSLRFFLEDGITTVRDQGGPRDAGTILSEWLEKDMAPGPRVFAPGHIITGTGGHAADRGTVFFPATLDARGDFEKSPNVYLTELKFLEKAGYSPAKALIAATRVNADILDMSDKLGTLEAGKLADVIVVKGQPDRNLDDLRNVETVIRNGNIVIKDRRLFVPRHVPVPLAKPSPPEALR